MYLHIGQNSIIKTDSIIGIFDMDTATIKKKLAIFYMKRKR